MIIKVNNSEKLIKFLIHNTLGLSFGSAQKLLRQGDVKVNGKRTKENITLNPNDEVEVYISKKSTPQVPIVYEDENIFIVNKPSGLECATRDKSSPNTYSLEELFESKNAIIVHRLDRLTSGLVIMAKNKEIAKELEVIFRTRQIEKYYMACVYGKFESNGTYTAYLYKDSRNSSVLISDTLKPDYKEIITEFNCLEYINNYSIIDIKLHTGRTHQIRAHLSHLGYTLINDSKYAKNLYTIKEYNGYMLSAYKLKFHITGKLNYLNNFSFEIVPPWLQIIKKDEY